MTDPQPIEASIVLRTSRLCLSTPLLSDASDTADSMTAGIHQWMLSWPFPMSESDAEQRITKCRTEVAAGDALHFVLRSRDSDEFIGWASTWRSARNRWRIGLWIAEPHQRRALGSEAASAAIHWTEKLIRPEAIDAAVSPDNERSIAMLKRLGMTEVGAEQFYVPGANGLRPHLIMERRFRTSERAGAERSAA